MTTSLHLDVHHCPVVELDEEIEVDALVDNVLLADFRVANGDVSYRLSRTEHS